MNIRGNPARKGMTERSARFAFGALLMIGASLAGCANTPPTPVAQAPADALIDPNDPLARWVPHMREASARFDVPEPWIRAVMLRESGGRATVNGRVNTSPAGALGLMQVMPGTYELMRNAYGLGPDPADPRDNVLAGTAYLREMYDLFGAPGFLAAYNCGPRCYAQHLAGKQKLPRETRMYLAALTSKVKDEPHTPSASSSATAVEVAVLPAKPEPAKAEPAPPPVIVAAAPPPAPAPVVAPPPVLAAAPAKERPQAAPLPAPAAPVQAAPTPAPPTPAAPIQLAAAQPAAKAGKPNIRYQIAEAFLQPGVDPERVQIRFVTQSTNGCGSLKGRDTVCVAQTPPATPARF